MVFARKRGSGPRFRFLAKTPIITRILSLWFLSALRLNESGFSFSSLFILRSRRRQNQQEFLTNIWFVFENIIILQMSINCSTRKFRQKLNQQKIGNNVADKRNEKSGWVLSCYSLDLELRCPPLAPRLLLWLEGFPHYFLQDLDILDHIGMEDVDEL